MPWNLHMMFVNMRDNHSTWESRSLSLNCLKMILIKYLCGQIIKKDNLQSLWKVQNKIIAFSLKKNKKHYDDWKPDVLKCLSGSKWWLFISATNSDRWFQLQPRFVSTWWNSPGIFANPPEFSLETPCFSSPSLSFPLGSQISSIISHFFPF